MGHRSFFADPDRKSLYRPIVAPRVENGFMGIFWVVAGSEDYDNGFSRLLGLFCPSEEVRGLP